MSTDRELLELAAKAINMNGKYVEGGDEIFGPYCGIEHREDGGVLWNPLNDDGDALRLAVKMGLQIFPDDMRDRTVALAQDNDDRIACAEKYDDDGCSATRRAIVRAAAEIGRRMP